MTIGSNVFDKLIGVSWDQAKTKLQSGDLLLCSGKGLMSDSIELATQSPFSHVAIILQLPITKQWLIMESTQATGVHCIPFKSGYLDNYANTGKGYPGKLLIARHEQVKKQNDLMARFFKRAFELLGCAYNQQDILKICDRLVAKDLGIKATQKILPKKQYICSEYVYSCFQMLGIKLSFDQAGFIAPSDVANNPQVFPVLQLNTSDLSQHQHELLDV